MVDYSPPNNIQDEVLTFLTSSPTPAQIIAFHASAEAQDRLRYLLDANREGTLTSQENAELEEASQLNHLFTLLKAKAHQTLQT